MEDGVRHVLIALEHVPVARQHIEPHLHVTGCETVMHVSAARVCQMLLAFCVCAVAVPTPFAKGCLSHERVASASLNETGLCLVSGDHVGLDVWKLALLIGGVGTQPCRFAADGCAHEFDVAGNPRGQHVAPMDTGLLESVTFTNKCASKGRDGFASLITMAGQQCGFSGMRTQAP